MTVDELLQRARAATKMPCTYKLGTGGFNPALPTPVQRGGCDCTGFGAWLLWLPRMVTHPLYVKLNGGWFETSAVWQDISNYNTGYFTQCVPMLGAVVVYPDRAGKQGHFGVVTGLKRGLPSKVVHCSPRNKKGYQIEETSGEVFDKPSAVYGWYAGLVS